MNQRPRKTEASLPREVSEALETLSLDNICGGAVPEVFARELDAVLKNIADVNVPAQKKRSLTLEIAFKPFEDRSGAEIEFSCKSKTVPIAAVKSRMYIAQQAGQHVAIPDNPNQRKLFPAPEAPAEPTNVHNIAKAKGA